MKPRFLLSLLKSDKQNCIKKIKNAILTIILYYYIIKTTNKIKKAGKKLRIYFIVRFI